MAGQVVPLNEGWSRIHKEGVLVLEEFLQEGTIYEMQDKYRARSMYCNTN